MEPNQLTQFITYSLLWLIPMIKGIKFVFSLSSVPKTPAGKEVDSSHENSRLDEKVKKEKLYLSEDVKLNQVKLVEIPNIDLAVIHGSLRREKKPFMIFSPQIDQVSEPFFFWSYKRLSFFLSREAFIIEEVVKVLASAFSVFIFSPFCHISFWGTLFLVLVFTKSISVVFKFFFDKAADTFATARSSVEELSEARLFLKAQIAFLSKIKSPYSPSFYYQKKFLYHRLEKIEKALGEEHAFEDQEKILLLEKFLEKNFQKEQEFIEAKKMKILKWIDADED